MLSGPSRCSKQAPSLMGSSLTAAFLHAPPCRADHRAPLFIQWNFIHLLLESCCPARYLSCVRYKMVPGWLCSSHVSYFWSKEMQAFSLQKQLFICPQNNSWARLSCSLIIPWQKLDTSFPSYGSGRRKAPSPESRASAQA